MPSANASGREDVLRNLPSVDEVLRTDSGLQYSAVEGATAAAAVAREVLDHLRSEIANGSDDVFQRFDLLLAAEAELAGRLAIAKASGVCRVINATGVVIHTNLGRAPLSDAAKASVLEAAESCTLEYDLATGKRGQRGGRVERLAAELAGAEAAVVVNNGAAAAYLVLSALASGGDVVISRGELVEIGGDFRIPDVLEASGARLKEVG